MNKDIILDYTKEETARLLELIGIDNEVEYSFDEGSNDEFVVVSVSIKGEDLGFMIGNKGRHLQALQSMLSMIVKNRVWKEDENARLTVIVDVGDYRKQRIDKLEKLALQKADDARILGDVVELAPMSPADRRVIHAVLSKFDDITTESEGEGFDRYVKIIPKSEADLGIVSETEDNASESEEEQE